jgi:hypothetical protein
MSDMYFGSRKPTRALRDLNNRNKRYLHSRRRDESRKLNCSFPLSLSRSLLYILYSVVMMCAHLRV